MGSCMQHDASIDPQPNPLAEVSLRGRTLREWARSEWVLTNSLGGFAMGTVSATPERRYHALLIAATKPPVGRVVALSAVDEVVVLEAQGGNGCVALRRESLSSFRWASMPASATTVNPALVRFSMEPGVVRWEYRPGGRESGVTIRKELALAHGRNACVLRYTITAPNRRAWLELRPLVALRDFHELLGGVLEAERYTVGVESDRELVVDAGAERVRVMVKSSREDRRALAPPRLRPEVHVWKDFEYRKDLERGMPGRESLLCPGVFVAECGGGRGHADPHAPIIEVAAWCDEDEPPTFDQVVASNAARTRTLVRLAQATSLERRALVLAADQFVVRRVERDQGEVSSIIAGYPWFSDWGRDTMIALRGLLISTGRLDEARECLLAFAHLRRDGLIPNCFDNGSGEAEYNTVDASLWFLQAACDLAQTPGGHDVVRGEILDACLDIIESYSRGTRFSIGVDPADGLVSAGDATTQLTWMDAKRNGVVFTPRWGKPVEINALWISGLRRVASLLGSLERKGSEKLNAWADRAGESFLAKFWDHQRRCLIDALTPTRGGDETRSTEIRPNQIFAAALSGVPLTQTQRQGVVACVREHLLTPMGLRTLSPQDPKYKPRFEGPLFDRDAAYHNGTVWPWLIGAYGEAVLRAGCFSPMARHEAASAIEPLERELLGRGRETPPSVLQLCEVYDADSTPSRPRRGDGCMAQAWSIAEVLRVRTLLESNERPRESTAPSPRRAGVRRP